MGFKIERPIELDALELALRTMDSIVNALGDEDSTPGPAHIALWRVLRGEATKENRDTILFYLQQARERMN